MKLKYYMRGLGIGMVVTAFILSVVLDKDTKTMSDDEVRARAKALGMVESTVLSQMTEQIKPDKTGTEETKPDDTQVQESTEPAESIPEEAESSENQTPETETSETETVESEVPEQDPPIQDPPTREPEDQEQSGTKVTIVINPGESSESVSRSLEAAGLVESAKQFDKYLCDNGYDYIISVGKYEIPEGASREEIAKIITRRK